MKDRPDDLFLSYNDDSGLFEAVVKSKGKYEQLLNRHNTMIINTKDNK
jgi:hypothetical protein